MTRHARTLVMGNSGSGKSWLAARIAAELGAPWIDLDHLFWEPGGYNIARDKTLTHAMLDAACAQPSWVVEGIYGSLLTRAQPRSDTLLWLCVDEAECIANITRRGPRRGGSVATMAALTAWAASYRSRDGSSGFAAHQALFDGYAGAKVRLSNRSDIAAFLATG
ncbi:adenylate kinase [Massilia sp. TSP1-1-2]|uniref:adenylate kinase n=1 Tax=Massilia sp. TSP1-1-2 TaxID=2804649 RepID=UPI003CEC199D